MRYPTSPILGPLLFLLYINDLQDCLRQVSPRLFADDTNLTAAGKTIEEVESAMNNDLLRIKEWLFANKLIKIGYDCIKQVRHSRALGVEIVEHLSWNKHIENVVKKVTSGIGAMRRIRNFVDRETLSSIYNALVRPHFDYCSDVWDTLGVGLSSRLQKLQNRAARIIMNMGYNTPGMETINALGWETLETRRAKSRVKQMYKVLNGLAPSSLAALFVHKRNMTEYDLRGSSTSLQLLLPKNENLKKSFCYDGAKLWNSLPTDMRDSDTLSTFINAIDARNF